jgi:hypothetical protein
MNLPHEPLTGTSLPSEEVTMKLASAVGLVIVLAASNAQAAFDTFSVATIRRMYVDGDNGRVLFGVDPVPLTTTCSFFGDQFFIDISTSNGAKMLAVVLFAKAQGGAIHVWYQKSSSPGTNETNGCNYGAMSRVAMIGVP